MSRLIYIAPDRLDDLYTAGISAAPMKQITTSSCLSHSYRPSLLPSGRLHHPRTSFFPLLPLPNIPFHPLPNEKKYSLQIRSLPHLLKPGLLISSSPVLDLQISMMMLPKMPKSTGIDQVSVDRKRKKNSCSSIHLTQRFVVIQRRNRPVRRIVESHPYPPYPLLSAIAVDSRPVSEETQLPERQTRSALWIESNIFHLHQ